MKGGPTPCPNCGALVLDTERDRHNAWHAALTELLDQIVATVEQVMSS